MAIDYTKLYSDLKDMMDQQSTESYNRIARKHGGEEVESLPADAYRLQSAQQAILWFEKNRDKYVT